MPTFTYQGYDGAGAKAKGEMTASSAEEVERRLTLQNVVPTAIVAKSHRGGGRKIETAAESSKGRARGKIKDSDRAGLLRDLATMVDAGVPFVEALEAVTEAQPKPALVRPLRDIRTAIIAGGSISAALRASNGLFPPLVADVVNVAEKGGRLDNALDNAASYLERSADLRRKIANAAMYPLVMMGISAIMMIVIVVFVLPRFGELFTKMKADLPVTTQAMLALGKFVNGQPVASASILVGSVAALVFLFRLPIVKRMIGKAALRVPGLGDLILRLGLARALRVMATLLNSNVPIMVALEHGSKVAGVPAISRALDEAADAIRVGGALSDALRRFSQVPTTVTQMVVVGERTGRLAALLGACAEKMETESDARLKSLVSVIEPLMILLMGVIVGGITISIITPIYSSVGNIK